MKEVLTSTTINAYTLGAAGSGEGAFKVDCPVTSSISASSATLLDSDHSATPAVNNSTAYAKQTKQRKSFFRLRTSQRFKITKKSQPSISSASLKTGELDPRPADGLVATNDSATMPDAQIASQRSPTASFKSQSSGGRGAELSGTFYLAEGTLLWVCVGDGGARSGGGGATIVGTQEQPYHVPWPLLVAGGGGGGVNGLDADPSCSDGSHGSHGCSAMGEELAPGGKGGEAGSNGGDVDGCSSGGCGWGGLRGLSGRVIEPGALDAEGRAFGGGGLGARTSSSDGSSDASRHSRGGGGGGGWSGGGGGSSGGGGGGSFLGPGAVDASRGLATVRGNVNGGGASSSNELVGVPGYVKVTFLGTQHPEAERARQLAAVRLEDVIDDIDSNEEDIESSDENAVDKAVDGAEQAGRATVSTGKGERRRQSSRRRCRSHSSPPPQDARTWGPDNHSLYEAFADHWGAGEQPLTTLKEEANPSANLGSSQKQQHRRHGGSHSSSRQHNGHNGGNGSSTDKKSSSALAGAPSVHLTLVLATQWEPDEAASQCPCCHRAFGAHWFALNAPRRHHCRLCGRVVCGACSSRLCPVPAGVALPEHGASVNTDLRAHQRRKRQIARLRRQAAAGALQPPPPQQPTGEGENSAAGSSSNSATDNGNDGGCGNRGDSHDANQAEAIDKQEKKKEVFTGIDGESTGEAVTSYTGDNDDNDDDGDEDGEGDRDERLPATRVRICDACHSHKQRVEVALKQGALQDAAELVARHEAWRAPSSSSSSSSALAGRSSSSINSNGGKSGQNHLRRASADRAHLGSAAAELLRLKRRALPLVLRDDGLNTFGPDGVGDALAGNLGKNGANAASGQPLNASFLTEWLLKRADSEAPADGHSARGSGGPLSPGGIGSGGDGQHNNLTATTGGGSETTARAYEVGEDAELRQTVEMLHEQLKFKSSQAQRLKDQLRAQHEQSRGTVAAVRGESNKRGAARKEENDEAAALRRRVREFEALASELEASAPDLFQQARAAAGAALQRLDGKQRGSTGSSSQIERAGNQGGQHDLGKRTGDGNGFDDRLSNTQPNTPLQPSSSSVASVDAAASIVVPIQAEWIAAGHFTFNPASGGAGLGLSKTLRVTRVDEGSAAARAGVQVGFRVVRLGTSVLHSLDEFRVCLAEHTGGGAANSTGSASSSNKSSTRLEVGLERRAPATAADTTSAPQGPSLRVPREAILTTSQPGRKSPTTDATQISDVLQQAGCAQFASAFALSGVATVAGVAALSSQELTALGLRKAHVKKLRRALDSQPVVEVTRKGRSFSSPRISAVAGLATRSSSVAAASDQRREADAEASESHGNDGLIAFLLGAR